MYIYNKKGGNMFFKTTPAKIDKWLAAGEYEKIIKTLISDDHVLAKKAAESVLKLDKGKATSTITAILTSGDTGKLGLAAVKATTLLKIQEVLPQISKLAESSNKEIAAEAIRCLGYLGASNALSIMLNALESNNEHSTSAAVDGLTAIGKPAVSELIKLAGSTKAVPIRVLAIKILGKIKDADAIEPLIRSLLDIHKDLVEASVQALIQIGKPAQAATIRMADNKETEASVCKILSEIGDSSAIDTLLKIITGENREAISYAAEALGNLGSNKVVDPLIALLADSRFQELKGSDDESNKQAHWNREIKKNAIKSLGSLGASNATDEIIKALKSGVTRNAAIIALINMGENAFSKALEKDQYFADDAMPALRNAPAGSANALMSILKNHKG